MYSLVYLLSDAVLKSLSGPNISFNLRVFSLSILTMPVCMVATVTRNAGVVALLFRPHVTHNGGQSLEINNDNGQSKIIENCINLL